MSAPDRFTQMFGPARGLLDAANTDIVDAFYSEHPYSATTAEFDSRPRRQANTLVGAVITSRDGAPLAVLQHFRRRGPMVHFRNDIDPGLLGDLRAHRDAEHASLFSQSADGLAALLSKT